MTRKKETRGHYIVADGWAEVSTPIHTPTRHTHSNIQKNCLKRSFPHFSPQSLAMDQQIRGTDGRTDGPTDGQMEGRTDRRTDSWG